VAHDQRNRKGARSFCRCDEGTATPGGAGVSPAGQAQLRV
ncbi:MAG: hypothetical protein, partial [Olavius algarvensis Gamma 1 endosymbiont]